MEKALFIIAQQDFQDQEYAHSREKIEAAGCEITVASIEEGVCRGKFGSEVRAELAVKDANVVDYAGVVVVGGPGALSLLEYPEVLELIRQFGKTEKLVAAICIAPLILAEAGVLTGKKATVYPNEEAIARMKEIGVEVQEDSIVVDKKTVTGNGPAAAYRFGEKVAELL